jgi:hypothetical protein
MFWLPLRIKQNNAYEFFYSLLLQDLYAEQVVSEAKIPKQ